MTNEDTKHTDETAAALGSISGFELGSLNQLAIRCYQLACTKGFHDAPRDPGLALALIHSEVSECLEAIRKPGLSEHCPELSSEGEELADILIRVFDFAAERGINIGEAVAAKMSYNASRPHMHGGKAF